jgi:eukaryotic-like serine/threonine-protein kinase
MAAPLQFVGQTLGQYRIIEQIGAGGMGVVYRARDERLERDVAVKVLRVATLADEAARKGFRKEALALAKLNHPNIATIFEFSSQNSTDYLVTEYISGQALDEKLATGALPGKEIVSLGIQLAQGLSAAHEHAIVHCDLKPANLRVTSDERLKILDFGLAQLMPHASEMGLTATVSKFHKLTGTLPYMAPEQLLGEPGGVRSDIWAAGAVLYEMATAHRPFEKTVPTALAGDIIHKAPPLPRRLRSEVSRDLEAVILKCLEKEPGERYSSARELQSELERLSTCSTPLAARRRLWPIITTGAIVSVMLAIGAFFYYFRQSPKLTEKDTIVLADFTNTTGDPVFDGTLRQGLAVQLEQSPFLSLVSEQQIQQTLRMMGQPLDSRLTPNIARDLCQRTESAAVLDGTIAQIGTRYSLILKTVSCSSGESIASTVVQASDKNHVLDALGKAASEIRGKLGESRGTVHKFDIPLEQSTTPSLEALQAYSLGWRTMVEGSDFAAAVPFFQRAVSLDSNFAMAYSSLGNAYWSLGESTLGTENVRKAYELRAQVSDRERFYIECNYQWATGDLEKARLAYELWAQTYPRDFTPPRYLAAIYGSLGQYDRALTESRVALRLDPGSALSYLYLVDSYLSLSRLEEAGNTAAEAKAKKLDSPFMHLCLYELAFLRNDKAGMAQQVTWAAGKSAVEGVLLGSEADTAAYSGQLRRAREFSGQAVASAERAKEKETAANYEADAALREALFGHAAETGERAIAALKLSTARDVQYGAALALAVAPGAARQTQVEKLAADLDRRFPEDTMVRFTYLPTVHAQLAFNRKDYSKAIEALQSAAPYELGTPSASWSPTLYPIYLRGEVYVAAHRGSEAAAEFQKILDHRGIVLNALIGALARLGLARAYALSGDTARSHDAYQDFLTLWKNADPDIPILKQAKAEYARLN